MLAVALASGLGFRPSKMVAVHQSGVPLAGSGANPGFMRTLQTSDGIIVRMRDAGGQRLVIIVSKETFIPRTRQNYGTQRDGGQ